MRWITPQELAKIARKSQASEKNIPERTIRHMALQKRLVTKKEGKTYLIDPASVLRAGLYIPPENLEELKLHKTSPPPEETAPSPSSEKNISTEVKTPDEVKKYTTLGELGVYNELKNLYLAQKSSFSTAIQDCIKQTLYNLALGFYEYLPVNKAEYFKRARKFLVGAIVEDDVSTSTRSAWRDQLENSVMPGIVGLIRKQEEGKRAKYRKKVGSS